MTRADFQELKPSGPIEGLIPVVSDRKQLNVKKEDSPTTQFLKAKISSKELEFLDLAFFEEYKKKELQFSDPDDKTEHIPMKYYQPLQFVMRASVRYLKVNHDKCLVAVTPHFIIFRKFKGKKLEPVGNIHVFEIKKLFHGRNYERVSFLQLRLMPQFVSDGKTQTKMKLNATITSPNYESIQKLTRVVYRNLSLAYANSPHRPQLLFAPTINENGVEVDADEENEGNFPPFDDFIAEKLSPSQRFQFTYAANCSHDYVLYNHEVVRYFHSQVINFNGVFNAGYIPNATHKGDKNSLAKRNLLYEMVPIFRSLIYSELIHGVVCDVKRPDIFKAVSYQLIHSSNIIFLHLSHVQASEGLSDLYVNMHYNIEDCGVIYFDFSGNNIKDEILNLNFKDAPESFTEHERAQAKTFFNIFQHYKTEVIYFSFNDCNFEEKHLIELFKAMNSYKSLSKLKYLHISSSQLIDEPRRLLKDYFDNNQTLVSLDIGNMPDDAKDIEKVMETLHHQPLECLYLYNDQINENCFKSLKNLIDDVPSLSVLDISGTGLTSFHVARIVDAMSSRQNYRMLTIKASRLGIYGIGTTEIVKGFLNGELDRWDTIYLDSNKMKTSDLEILIPVFQQMINLRELSLSDNFDSEMMGIDVELCNLLRIPGLRILRLAGSTQTQLGNKIKPLILAMALSYQLRSKIGGLSIENRLPKQKAFSEKTDESIIPILRQLNVKKTDTPGYSKYLQKKFDHILKPFLMEVSKETAIAHLQSIEAVTEWRKIFRDLVPLIEKCRGIYQYKKNDIKKKSIANYTMEILVQWTQKVPMNTTTSIEDEIIKACESIDKGKWINMASNLAHLKHLDIKEVKIELDVINSLLKIDKELRGIEIDGCGVRRISSIVDFVEAIENQPNLTKVPFPAKDKENIISQVIPDARRVVEDDLNDLQVRLMTAINKHRFEVTRTEEDEIPEYPFETIPEIQSYIYTKNVSKKNLRSHSGICEDFSMQLPYLRQDGEFTGLPDDYYIENDEIIKKMLVYQFEPPPFQNKPPEKSIAIQERFYEIDPDKLNEMTEPEQKVPPATSDDSDSGPLPETTDFEKMKHKIKTTLEYLPSDQNLPMNLGEGDEEEERSSSGIEEEESSNNEISEIPFFDLDKGQKKKLNVYGRGIMKIDVDDTTEIDRNLHEFETKHSDLDAVFTEDKNYKVENKFKAPPKGADEPPD